MHYPWIRSVTKARQIPGISSNLVFHWAFDRPNGNIIEADTGPRSVNFTGQWINDSGNNWAVRLDTTTGASTQGPVLYGSDAITVKFRFRPLSYESGGATRYLVSGGAGSTYFSINNNFNKLIFTTGDTGSSQANIGSANSLFPVGYWYDVVATFTTRSFPYATGAAISSGSNIARIWVNGVARTPSTENTGGAMYGNWFGHGPLTIGTTTGSGGFNCDLDYIKIFSGYQSYPLGNP